MPPKGWKKPIDTSGMTKEAIQARIAEIEAKMVEVKQRKLLNLRAFEKFKNENKIQFVPLSPHPKQKLILDAWLNPKYKVFTYTGANRTAKTTSWVWIADSVMAGHYLWKPEVKIAFPHDMPRRIRVIGQDWEKHIKTVVVPKLREWWPKSRRVDIKKNSLGVEATWLDIATGSTLEIMSNNQESDFFEGWDGDLIIYDEPPARDIRVACARGLIDRNGREYFGMTLLKQPWISREVINATNADGTPDTSVFNVHAVIWDNVSKCGECGGYIDHFEGAKAVCEKCGPVDKFQRFGLDLEGVRDYEKKLTESEKQARLYGIPSYMANIIWPIKRSGDGSHLKKRFKIPLDWIVDVQIDFHPAKPWAVLFLATGPYFKYVIHEIWAHGNPKFMAEEIVRVLKANQYRVGSIEIDPLAKGDSNNDETVFEIMRRTFGSFGYTLRPASKDKDNGITIVRDLLHTENDMPGLFFFDDLRKCIEQIENWTVDPDTLKPSKEEDDFCECLYRHGLLNTQWFPLDNEEARPRYRTAGASMGRSAVTGY